MPLKLAWDADGEKEQSILIDRHTNLLLAVTDAIEAAIKDNNGAEAEQGFGRMTGMEISSVMANAVICALQERGVNLRQFLKDLADLAQDLGWD